MHVTRRIGFLFAMNTIVVSAVGAQAPSPDSPPRSPHDFAGQGECQSSRADEVVVCADRGRKGDRYRLPLPDERDPDGSNAHVRGEIPRASAENPSAGGCGLFQGQRHCGKAEALRYGYGGGNDPLTFALKLSKLLLDRDADVSPPPTLPQRFRREEPK
jgi:hypothetical protein